MADTSELEIFVSDNPARVIARVDGQELTVPETKISNS